MERSILLTLAFTALATGAAFADAPTVITVFGNDDPATDRQAIQDAIDAAGAGSVVELAGTFQLDGQRVRVGVDRLEIRGALVDEDGDGRHHEDWPDGRDNDGDGLVDEDGWDAVLRGVTGPGGEPVLDDGVTGLFNRAFVVDGAYPPITGLTIRDLAFEGFNRAIELWPEWASPTGRCDDRVRVPGSMRDVRIEDNRFTNNDLGITMLGDVSHSTVGANVFERHGTFGAIAEGGRVRCPLTGGSRVLLEVTSPRQVTLHHNLGVESALATGATEGSHVFDNVLEGGTFGIFTGDDTHARVVANRISGTLVGITVFGGQGSSIVSNTVDALLFGVDLAQDADGVLVAANELTADVGARVDFRSSGFRIVENSFPASGFVDVELSFGSSQNVVVNGGAPITVLDLGADNRLLGNIVPF